VFYLVLEMLKLFTYEIIPKKANYPVLMTIISFTTTGK